MPDGYGDEIYMPPLIAIASNEGKLVHEFRLSDRFAHAALGVNTIDELLALNTR